MAIYHFIVALILLVCILLAVVVLIQNSKGGGLAANFSAPTEIMGVRKTTDFLEKATWWLAIALVVLSLAATMAIPRNHINSQSDREQTEQTEQTDNTPSATGTSENSAK